jgi:hypothetical protein
MRGFSPPSTARLVVIETEFVLRRFEIVVALQ